MRGDRETVKEEDTLLEMLTVVRDGKQRAAAEPGAHDDCVMALAIAHYVRPQQTMEVKRTAAAGTAAWTQDMWDDFERAAPQEREMLLQKWGTPR